MSKRLLTDSQISKAIHEAYLEMNGITEAQYQSDPDSFMPDGDVIYRIPDEVALKLFNRAICKAQDRQSYAVIIRKLTKAWRIECKANWNIKANNNLPKWIRGVPKTPTGGACDRHSQGGGLRKLEDQVMGKVRWPTPHSRDWKGAEGEYWKHGAMDLPAALGGKAATGGQLNPTWVSWLMGFPLDWLDIGQENPKESQESPLESKTE
jgi:hypothetical protein